MLKDRKNSTTPTPKPEDTSVAKFFEEIKVLVRDIPERVAIEVNGSYAGCAARGVSVPSGDDGGTFFTTLAISTGGSRDSEMADKSPIEWTDATWNPVTGCDKISPGCKHCYAERLAHRLQAIGNKNY